MEVYLYNNQLVQKEDVSIHPDDRGYHFGDGIYEVVRVYDKKPFAMIQHLERLAASAKKLDIPLPYPLEEIERLILQMIEKNNLTDGIVYFQITRGISPRNHLFTREEVPVLTGFAKELPVERKEGIKLYLTKDIRWLRCDIKTINLLGNVLAKREASDHGCDEALLHREGTVTEGSSSNFFVVKDKTLFTHPATNLILNGISRQIVLQLADKLGYSVIEEAFPKDILHKADEAFMTSTTLEVTPVTEIVGDETARFSVGPVTQKLQQAFYEEVSNQSITVAKQ